MPDDLTKSPASPAPSNSPAASAPPAASIESEAYAAAETAASSAPATATVELEPIAAASAMPPTREVRRFDIRAQSWDDMKAAHDDGHQPGPSPSKPGAFPISHTPQLAHIGESRIAIIGIEIILDGPARIREEALRLVTAGFNALAIPLFDEGYTLFQSAAMAEMGLPRQHPDLRRRDVMAEFSELARNLKTPLLLTVDFLKAGDRGLGVRYPALRKRRRWAMRNAAGHMLPLGPETQCPMFCPSSRGVADYYASVCLEAATAYPVAGYILEMPPLIAPPAEAPASDFCYCMECRERFLNELTGGENPALHRADPGFRLRRDWQFRRRVQQALLHIRTRVLETRSDCLFFVQGSISRDSASAITLSPGAAWYPLVANGAFNGAFVSNYSFCGGDFSAELDTDAALLVPHVNLCAALRSIRAETLAEQINRLRDYGACGFLVTHAAGLSAASLDMLTSDAMPWPAFYMESSPRRTVENCLRRLQYISAGCSPLAAFVRDTGRYIANRLDHLGISDIEAMIDNVENFRTIIRQNKLPLGKPPQKVQRLLAKLQKSLFMLCKTLRG